MHLRGGGGGGGGWVGRVIYTTLKSLRGDLKVILGIPF